MAQKPKNKLRLKKGGGYDRRSKAGKREQAYLDAGTGILWLFMLIPKLVFKMFYLIIKYCYVLPFKMTVNAIKRALQTLKRDN